MRRLFGSVGAAVRVESVDNPTVIERFADRELGTWSPSDASNIGGSKRLLLTHDLANRPTLATATPGFLWPTDAMWWKAALSRRAHRLAPCRRTPCVRRLPAARTQRPPRHTPFQSPRFL